jgi:hypothetical protein
MPEAMKATECIAQIQDVFDRWRTMGSCRLRSGTELIGRLPEDEQEAWMHAIYQPLDAAGVDRLEAQMQRRLPKDLRALYRRCRGMSLFQGAFQVHGWRDPGFRSSDHGLQPEDVLDLNHSLDILGWRTPQTVAFAVNSWDQSVYAYGMTNDDRQVARCERSSGLILEVHDDIWQCLVERLYRLDRLLLTS